jgi:hypothetical protein
MIAAPTPSFFPLEMTSTRSSPSRARSAVASVEPSSTTKMWSTNVGMPATVEPTSASSL